MADRAQCRQQLASLFQAELHCAARLTAILDQEAAALVSRDADRMESIVADKNRLMQEFETLESQRFQLVESAGFKREEMDACIRWCDERGQLDSSWHQLLEQIRQCQHRNRTNGAVVETSRRHVQQVLGLLRGQTPEASLYNPSGAHAAAAGNGRTLAKA